MPLFVGMDGRRMRPSIRVGKVFATSANGIDSYFGYVKLLWVQRHEPELFAKIKTILITAWKYKFALFGIHQKSTVFRNAGGIHQYYLYFP